MPIKKPLLIKQPVIGQLIRALRKETGLTQEQFAVQVGVVYTTVNRWENGNAQPSPLAMKLIEQKLLEIGKRGQELLEQYCTE